MKSRLYHIEINCSDFEKSTKFYKSLLSYLEYQVIHEDTTTLGMSNKFTSFWIIKTKNRFADLTYHRSGPGVNHIAFKVGTKEDVDQFTAEFLKKNKFSTLYDSPKHFPEYTEKYYAVYFEDPDRIKLEVAYS